MNKTIIININGIVFHIEEDAYEVLINYMNEVKKHFGYSTDSYEIVNDIEGRLAEMFSEKLAKNTKQVLVIADVEAVTQQMGKPTDFDLPDEETVFTQEPVRTDKKLFRDIDDRIIGGVCAGIGHYFSIEARWLRIAFVLAFVFFGTGLFAYLLLWLVMPKANTRAEKLAMKGEAPNLQNFKKNFDEEMASVKEQFNKAQTEVQPFFQRLGRFIEQLFVHLGAFLRGSGKIIIKVIGAFIIGIGLCILFALLVGLMAVLGVWNSSDLPVFPFNVVNPDDQAVLYICAFLVVIIPLVSLILFAIRVLFNRASLNRNSSFALLMLWIVALSTGLYYGFKTAGEFKEEAKVSQTQELKPYTTYYLKLNDLKFLTKEDSVQLQVDKNFFNGTVRIDNSRNEQPENVRLYIESTEEKNPSATIQYIAHGKNFETALSAVKRIRYRFSQQDSVVRFDEAVHIPQQELWRNQRVRITLRIPNGTRLVIDPSVNEYLDYYNLYDCIPENARSYQADGKGDPSKWIMSKDVLTCDTLQLPVTKK